ncbi:MAG: hypothetical protein LBJ18_03330 [Rickettsiales bacterium]|jgi:hypothetical protein|nr:hypothetical protein [Rickettsiales bacterium]
MKKILACLCCCVIAGQCIAEKKSVADFGSGDWEFSVTKELSDRIEIERCSWGMGWSCSGGELPKVEESGGVKLYSDGETKVRNSNGKWQLIAGHMRATTRERVAQFGCKNFRSMYSRTIDVFVDEEKPDQVEIVFCKCKEGICSCGKEYKSVLQKKDMDGIFVYFDDRIEVRDNNGNWELVRENICPGTTPEYGMEFLCGQEKEISALIIPSFGAYISMGAGYNDFLEEEDESYDLEYNKGNNHLWNGRDNNNWYFSNADSGWKGNRAKCEIKRQYGKDEAIAIFETIPCLTELCD